MPTVALYNMEGKEIGTVELAESIFGVEVNGPVIHSVVKNYLANQRQGTQSTKTRTEVRGGGIKPWRQKGTGRARQGSIRAPQWTGGGVALGPKPRDYRYAVNKKIKRVALKSALSSKVLSNDIIVVDGLQMEEIKTSKIAAMLNALNADKALVVTAELDKNVYLSARNIKNVKPTYVSQLNTYDVIKYNKLVVAKDAIQKIEEVLS